MKVKIKCIYDSNIRQVDNFGSFNGVSFLLETNRGRMLFDAGLVCWRLLRNLRNFKISPDS
ncbi:MAG: hypothetical protein KAT03_07205, partial [Candidatus Heimdallarchaeota archaeon]|nr:hypothetical protein [Candidatus Heimdallarchaeota archaeon]